MSRATLAMAAASVVIGASAPVCLAGKYFHKTLEVTLEHVEGGSLHVVTRNGSIEIGTHDGEDVVISAKLSSDKEERVEAGRIVATRGDGDELRIGVEWPSKWRGKDGCSLEVLVPDASGVYADTRNGSIVISGLSGALTADTSNGTISIDDHDGPVNVDTSNGWIGVREVTGAVVADTSNGAIDIVLSDSCAGPVEADTSNGAVSLEVGSSFVGIVKACASGGIVHFGTFPDGMDVRTAGADRMMFGGVKKPVSKLDTSNGSVKVTAREGEAL